MTEPTDPWDPDNLVPLAVLAAEGLGNGTVEDLARRVGGDLVIDDIGIRCCTRSAARALFAKRDAQQAAERERRKEREAAGNPVQDRVRALQAIGAQSLIPEEPDWGVAPFVPPEWRR